MDTVNRAKELMHRRLVELDRERKAIEKALASIEDRVPIASSRSAAGRRRAGKRAQRGQRQDQFLTAVRAQPGAKISAIAREIGVKPQQLYPIARRLAADGVIAKSDGGYAIAKTEATASG